MHFLISERPGLNRGKPGEYKCVCGVVATGRTAFKKHRAAGNKTDKETALESVKDNG